MLWNIFVLHAYIVQEVSVTGDSISGTKRRESCCGMSCCFLYGNVHGRHVMLNDMQVSYLEGHVHM